MSAAGGAASASSTGGAASASSSGSFTPIDELAKRTWASIEKETGVDGTWEEPDVAFQCFLGPRPAIFGTFGFHCTPQIGVYNHEDYTPTLPIGLISIPLRTGDAFRQLPDSVAAVAAKCVELRLLDAANVEVYVIVHSGLTLRECGHLRCPNRDEFNVMYHSWVFAKDSVADTHDEIIASVHMGVFEAHGVIPVHLEFNEGGGMAFDRLSMRRVLLHDRRFSPNNANVRVDGRTDTPIFFTFAIDRVLRTGVVALHVLPIGDGPSDRIREWIRGKKTMLELLTAMREHIPIAATHLERMLKPMA